MSVAPARIETAAGAFPALDVGAGEPVLLLHGAVGDWRTLAPVAERLTGRRVVAVTQRWFGVGDWPEDGPPFGVQAHAEDLCAMLDALGPAHVVAWSYAAHPSMLAAAARPSQMRSLLIYEPGCSVGLRDGALAAWKADARAWIEPIMAAPDLTAAARTLVDNSMGEQNALASLPADRRAVVLENAPMLARLFRRTPPPAEDPPPAAMPARVGAGARSRPLFRLGAEGAAAALGCGPVEEIEGVGHFWPVQDPDAFAAWVSAWLDEATA